MKLVAANPIVHANLASYKAMVYKMNMPMDISEPPTIELYKRGLTVSEYNPNFANGKPADFYTNLHTVQIDWEIEGGYDTCFFGVIYNRNWEQDTPVVFTDMHYNSREGSGLRELVLYRAEGIIDSEADPKPYPNASVVVNDCSVIYSDSVAWDTLNNHVVVIDETPIDTYLKIRVVCGHSNLNTALGIQHIGANQVFKFFVPDNYSDNGGGCGCGGGGDLSELLARFDNLDAAVYAVKQDTASTNTLANNIEYLSNEIQDKVNRVDQGMPAGFNMIGAKVDLVGGKVDTQATAVGSKVDAVGLKVDAADGKVQALDTKVTAQATTLGQKVDAANAAITSVDGKISTEGNLTRTAVTSESTAIKGKIDAIDLSSAGIPQNVIDMIMDLHAEALGSWTWNKRTGILTMLDTHGLEVAAFTVADTPDGASRERRTDLELS